MTTTTACAVAAVGMINALGGCPDEIWPRLIAGDQSGLSKRDDFVLGRSLLVGEVREVLPVISPRLRRYACRNNAPSLAAFRQIEGAVRDAMADLGPQRIGVVMGSSTSGIAAAEEALTAHLRSGELPPSFDYHQLEFGGVAAFLAAYVGIEGPAYTLSTACSSSAGPWNPPAPCLPSISVTPWSPGGLTRSAA